MKKFEVELQYTSYVIYTVEANTKEEAEDKAWKELDKDSRSGYGEWVLSSIEETKGE
jgi:hypothetical protein